MTYVYKTMRMVNHEIHAMKTILDLLTHGFEHTGTDKPSSYWREVRDELEKEVERREAVLSHLAEENDRSAKQ